MKQPTAPVENNSEKIYPILEENSINTETDNSQNYRLEKISEIEKTLKNERDTRRCLYKRYKRGINIIDTIDTSLITASIAMASVGFAIPFLLPLEIAAGVCAGLGVCVTLIRRRLNTKTKKHSEIKSFAESKLNSIKKLVSKALEDGKISELEFKMILTELENYNTLKKEKLSENRIKELTEEERKNLIEKGRTIALGDRERLIAEGKAQALAEIKKKMTDDV